ncbi:MAG: endonuclease Q family protein [Candidatus Magasanikbacteria bacterium]|nr:endonuclease Q family protein [Candidatus Magasanikbacteria bacterium]
MIKQILDLHIHSKYSRACSKRLELSTIAKACEIRGIDIVATGDFTHPKWFESIKNELVESSVGVYKLKNKKSKTKFILGTEVSSIKKHKGKTRRVHLLIFAPNIEIAEKFNKTLEQKGFNLKSDGRPILGIPSKDILKLMLEVDERMVMIPAHAWTPWFGIFGSKGGYNSLEEAFDELSVHINAIETGLSSDPAMNWRLSALDNITLISNSDAHSLQKLGREANVFQFKNESEITYKEIIRIIQEGDKTKFLNTIEFYPEEGKYHVDGHRGCRFFCEPEETKKLKGKCPKCKKSLIIGVLNRVVGLADRTENEAKKVNKIPYKSIVPLPEILSGVLGRGVNTKTVQKEYDNLIENIGSEFFILLDAKIEDIHMVAGDNIAKAVDKVRKGEVVLSPGYDGEFGKVNVK